MAIQLKNKILVEIIPALNSGACCETQESDCCDTNETNSAEVQDIKEQILAHFTSNVSVYVYDYKISLDRALATKKLTASVKEKGYTFIKTEQIMETAPTTVYINNEPISFLKNPNINEIFDSIEGEMKKSELNDLMK